MKIKVKLSKAQYDSLMFCTNNKRKVPVSDMLKYFSPFLDEETKKKTYKNNDVFVFTM